MTQASFGDYSVVANWNKTGPFQADGYTVAPEGFLARTQNGLVVAGAFVGSFDGQQLSPGAHYLIVERQGDAVTVSQPLGSDTALSVVAPSGGSPRAIALDAKGSALGEVPGVLRAGRFEFQYRSTVDGRPVDSYRIAAG